MRVHLALETQTQIPGTKQSEKRSVWLCSLYDKVET